VAVTAKAVAVARGKTAGGSAGIRVDVAPVTGTIGVAEAPPHPLKSDITKIVAIPHVKIR
jgi:hypothetical protein